MSRHDRPETPIRELAPELIKYVRPHSLRLLQAILCMTLLAAIRGGVVYLMGPVIQGVFVDKNREMLRLVLLALPAMFLVRMVVDYTNSYLMSYVGQKAVQKIREDIFTHIHSLSLEFHWRRRSSDVMSTVINDLQNVQNVVQTVPLHGVRDVATVIACVGVLFYLNWRLALLGMLILPITGGVIAVLSRKMRRTSAESNALVGEISHRFQESLQGAAVVKAFNYEQQAIARFKASNDAYFSRVMRYLRAANVGGPLMEFLGSLVLVGIIYFGGQSIFEGRLTAAHFFSFVGGFISAYLPIKNIANLNARLQNGMASWERVHRILRERPAVEVKADPARLGEPAGRIEFKGVSYRYPSRDTQVLDGLSFAVEPGQVAAFVGPSGSGKSTIIQLLLRFFDPQAGVVELDGRDLTGLHTTDLREHIGLVTQDTVLFDDTVRGNITIGRPGATAEEVIAAAKAADAHAFISAMPQGYDTPLGERGVKLSGGQRQRLAIARAIIKKPKILLLDEATSNLDTASEQAVQTAIENILGERTVIMVAHRLSTVKNADRIFVLKHGRLAETGTHEELLAKGGIYRGLYEAQN